MQTLLAEELSKRIFLTRVHLGIITYVGLSIYHKKCQQT